MVDGFYEHDEPLEDVLAAYESGEEGLTASFPARTWRDRLPQPWTFAVCVVHSVQEELRRPVLIEVAANHREPALLPHVGPRWLRAASTALMWADLLTGHYWCSRGPRLFDIDQILCDRYGKELHVAVSSADLAEYCALRRWHGHDDDDAW